MLKSSKNIIKPLRRIRIILIRSKSRICMFMRNSRAANQFSTRTIAVTVSDRTVWVVVIWHCSSDASICVVCEEIVTIPIQGFIVAWVYFSENYFFAFIWLIKLWNTWNSSLMLMFSVTQANQQQISLTHLGRLILLSVHFP